MKLTLISLFILFFASCKTLERKVQHDIPKEISFYLQPYHKTEVFLNNKKVNPKVLEKNKTLALFSLTLANELPPHEFRVVNMDGKELTYKLTSSDYQKAQKKIPLFFQLLPPKTPLRALSRLPTCHKPKSVRFLDQERVLVSCLEDTYSEIINVISNERRTLAFPKEISKAKGFVESLIIEERGEFWISQMTTASIHAFSLKDYQYLKSITTSGKWSKVLLWDKYRRKIYVSNWLSKDISVIDPEKGMEIDRFPVPGIPRGMALSWDGHELIVALFGSQNDSDGQGALVGLNLDTGKITYHIKNLGTMRHIVPGDFGEHYLSDMSRNQICRLEKQKLSCLAKTFPKPNTIAYDENRKWLIVSNRGPNNPKSYLLPGLEFGRIAIYQTPTLSLLYDWEAGDQPTGLDLSADKKFIATTDFLEDALRVYEILDIKAL